MMLPISVICLPIFTSSSEEAGLRLGVKGSTFVVAGPNGQDAVPMRSAAQRDASARALNRHGRWAVWDHRGLTVRDGKWVRSFRFEAVSTSPKFCTREEIQGNLKRLRGGDIQRGADALSGMQAIDDRAFFLARWRDKSGDAWLEALAEVDLSKKHPEPVVVERIEGYSFAEGSVDDRLLLVQGRLAVVARSEKTWGLALFNPSTRASAYLPLGEKLYGYKQLEPATIVYAETTESGAKRVGLADLATQKRKDLVESRDFESVLPGRPLVALMAHGKKRSLRTLGSGAEMPLLPTSGCWRSKYGVIVGNAREAFLYDPADWKLLAKFKAT